MTRIEIFILMIPMMHFIGDFVFQSTRVAQRKSTDMLVLLEHVWIYGAALYLGVLIFIAAGETDALGAHRLYLWVVINIVFHFVIDLVTAPMATYYKLTDQPRKFFLVIGGDQMLHLFCLIGTIEAIR